MSTPAPSNSFVFLGHVLPGIITALFTDSWVIPIAAYMLQNIVFGTLLHSQDTGDNLERFITIIPLLFVAGVLLGSQVGRALRLPTPLIYFPDVQSRRRRGFFWFNVAFLVLSQLPLLVHDSPLLPVPADTIVTLFLAFLVYVVGWRIARARCVDELLFEGTLSCGSRPITEVPERSRHCESRRLYALVVGLAVGVHAIVGAGWIIATVGSEPGGVWELVESEARMWAIIGAVVLGLAVLVPVAMAQGSRRDYRRTARPVLVRVKSYP